MFLQSPTLRRVALGAAILAVGSASASAAISTSVVFNSTTNFAGITTWPHPVTVNSAEVAGNSPGTYITVTEGNLGNIVDGFSFAQSFTATTTGKLTEVQLPITGTAPVSFRLHVYDGLGKDWTDISVYDPDGDMSGNQFVPGTDVSNDLLADTTVQTWLGYTEMGATAAVLGVTLTGADQVSIDSGKTYIVEFELNPDNDINFANPLLVGRNGANGDNSTNYTGGQAFRARKPLNGNALRDIAMAITVSSASPPLAGDFNEVDGVTAADLAVWESGFGTLVGALHTNGDADADHDVDGADVMVWQEQLGQGLAVGVASAIPEPTSAILGVFCVVAGVARNRRRGSN